MTTNQIQAGNKVTIEFPADHVIFTTKWFPKTGATGTVQKVFKNGTAAVAVDQIRNFSADGLHTLHIEAEYLRVRGAGDAS